MTPDRRGVEAEMIAGDNLLAMTETEAAATATDLAGFAREFGHDGPPFRWDDERRRHRRGQLDALCFHPYGLSRDDAADVRDSFPIVSAHDRERHGRWRTKHLILAYYHAYTAGDLAAAAAG